MSCLERGAAVAATYRVLARNDGKKWRHVVESHVDLWITYEEIAIVLLVVSRDDEDR